MGDIGDYWGEHREHKERQKARQIICHQCEFHGRPSKKANFTYPNRLGKDGWKPLYSRDGRLVGYECPECQEAED
jgi:predicted RNA-binding Zn-ribbon protein involved in translation (DUF1610 family)